VNRQLAFYRLGERIAAVLPTGLALKLGQGLGAAVGRLPDWDRRRALVASHVHRLMGPDLGPSETKRLVAEVFGYYGRYWAESLRLPSLPLAEVAAGIELTGFDYVERCLAGGKGLLIAAPHLGGWEWGAMYLAAGRGLPMTVAVEPLSPPELFDWFAHYRQRLGMHVVPVGPRAAGQIMRALRDGHIVCLLSDRTVGGTAGVEVDFFGAATRLPAGPVTLALRSDTPLLAAAIYYGQGPGDHHIVFRPPLELARSGNLRADVQSGTQVLAKELEDLIRAAPTQWHLFQPNWPGDPCLRTKRRLRAEAPGGAAEEETGAEASQLAVVIAPQPSK
jgi:lauroyl/myristoyl acyltransferase